MLLAAFLSTLFYSASYPYIYAETVKAVPQYYLSLEQILACLGIIVFCRLWNRFGNYLFKYYHWILLIEVIADLILFLDVIIRGDLRFYFLLNIIIYAIITRNLCCGGIKMRARIHPTEDTRERYDNNLSIVSSVATLAGASVALVVKIPLSLLFILALIGNTIDNIIYLCIYIQIRKVDKQ